LKKLFLRYFSLKPMFKRVGKYTLYGGCAMTAGITVQAYRKDWWTPSDSELLRTNDVKLPLIARLFTLLPKPLYTYLSALAIDPKRELPKDKQDIFGLSPYTYSKLKEDIWSVRYEYDVMSGFAQFKDDPIAAQIGFDFFNKDLVPPCLASPRPGMDRDELEKDFQCYFEILDRLVDDKSPPEDKEDRKIWWYTISTGKYTSVVKLKSGGIILYDPPRMRTELVDWLKKNFGEVKYIISPSSVHTMFLKEATDMFPNARLVASNMAMQKMRNKGYEKPAECEYTDQEQLRIENELLAAEGIKLISINGDALTSALVLHHKPSKSLLNCDLHYSPSESSLKRITGRVINAFFRQGSMNGSDLPKYRFLAMDHTAGLCNCSLGDCADMAASLREVLTLDFVTAYGSHHEKVDGVQFKSNIDVLWGWLDGKSLLS